MNEIITENPEKYEKVVREIVLDIQRTFDATIISSFMLIMLITIILIPAQGFESLENKMRVSVPVIGTFVTSLVFALYHSGKFFQESDRFKKFTTLDLKNKNFHLISYLSLKEKISFLQLILYIKYLCKKNESSDFGDELDQAISTILES